MDLVGIDGPTIFQMDHLRRGAVGGARAAGWRAGQGGAIEETFTLPEEADAARVALFLEVEASTRPVEGEVTLEAR